VSLRVNPPAEGGPRWRLRLGGDDPVVGMWVASCSAYCAEICAGADLDWLLIDTEHVPNDLQSVLAQLQAVAPYDVTPVVRPASGDSVVIKQLLDLGAEVLLVPMVESAAQAEELVRAVRYPPEGIRGVGSALARASRWNRVEGYLQNAAQSVSLMVQVESQAGLDALPEIAAVDGVDGVFLGPADLAGSLGHLGKQDQPDVVQAIEDAIKTIVAAGKAAGVNAFIETLAERYLAAGAKFVLVGADVTLLARGSDELAARHRRRRTD
jgi:4-hydroxy-2-oxoheptanedioate aldolase